MKKLLLCLSLISSTYYSIGQELIESAASEPTYNASGDPQTNIIDADGAQQGEWYYHDIYEQKVAKKVFKDNNCVGTAYFLNGKWRDSEQFEADPIIIYNSGKSIKDALAEKGIQFELNPDQQLLLIVNDKNEIISFSPLGSWDKSVVNELRSQIETILMNNHLNLQNETVILL